MKRIHHVLMTTITGAVVLMSLLTIYWKFIDGVVINKPIVWNSDQNAIMTDKTEYKRGDVVRGTLSFCKLRAIPAHLQWTLVDHHLIMFAGRDTAVGVGCREVEFDIEQIPPNANPGLMHFEGLLTYKINPFSTISIPLTTVNFDVY